MMRDLFKKFIRVILNKGTIIYLLGALTGAAGVHIPAETIGAVVCALAPAISGCGAEEAPIAVVEQAAESK